MMPPEELSVAVPDYVVGWDEDFACPCGCLKLWHSESEPAFKISLLMECVGCGAIVEKH